MTARTTLVPPGQTGYLLGAGFFPPDEGPLFLAELRPEPVSRAIAATATAGFTTLRVLLPAAVFLPGPDAVAADAVERFRGLLALAAEARVGVLPAVIAGPFPKPGPGGFDAAHPTELFADPAFARTAAALGQALAAAARTVPDVVVGWEVAAGLPRRGGRPLADAAALALFRAVRDAIAAGLGAEVAPTVAPGDGLLTLHGDDAGLAPEVLAREATLLSTAVEPRETDVLRHTYQASFAAARLRPLGRPFILSEFGTPRSAASDEATGAEIHEVLLSVLTDGACGACFRQAVDLAPEGPGAAFLEAAPNLGHSGATTAGGDWRATAKAHRTIADLLARAAIRPDGLRLPPSDAVIVVPDALARSAPEPRPTGLGPAIPPAGPLERAESERVLLEAFTLLRSAGATVDVLTEAGLARLPTVGYQLVVAPLGHRYRASGWRRILEMVSQGATAWVPWSGGYEPAAAGFPGVDLGKLTGSRPKLRPGFAPAPPAFLRVDLSEREKLEVEVAQDETNPLPISFCPVSAKSAETVAKDQDGRVAIVRTTHGNGRVLFASHPWERLLVRYARSRSKAGGPGLYRFLTREAGIRPWAVSDGSRVEARAFRHAREDGGEDVYLVAINRGFGKEEVAVRLDLGRIGEGMATPPDPERTEAIEVWPDQGEVGYAADRIVVSLGRKEARLFRCVSRGDA